MTIRAFFNPSVFLLILFVQHTVESNKQRCSEHQGTLQGARQSGIKHQDELQVASVRSSSDQVVLIEAEWGSTEARDMVEAVPYLDQLIHSVQEVMPRGLGGQSLLATVVTDFPPKSGKQLFFSFACFRSCIYKSRGSEFMYQIVLFLDQ